MKNTLKFLLIALIMFSFSAVKAQKEVGIWKTIDDETNKPKSYVELYIKNGKLYGKVVKLLNNDEENPLCEECEGNLHNQPIIGMQIVNGLTKRKSDWYKKLGILDPANGKVYDCKMWLEDENTLNVRGFMGPFYRTQTWYRVE
ncbi:MAG: DUF2147 domain-containing protein [Marinilabiliales bacterium]|nr:MAG: DUF2147 domain-containing protein [Marinilabiliales bacterium]